MNMDRDLIQFRIAIKKALIAESDCSQGQRKLRAEDAVSPLGSPDYKATADMTIDMQ